MKDILIILGMCIAAILVGTVLFFSPSPAPVQENALPAGSDQSAGAGTAAIAKEAVPFRVLDAGTDARMTARKNYAARDEESLARLWQMAHGDENIPLPSVDFANEYVIGVFAGGKSSGGYSIAVDAVSDYGDVRTVAATVSEPAPSCITTQALTSPYQIIAVPASLSALKAEDATAIVPCP
jgi:hypothetical protein